MSASNRPPGPRNPPVAGHLRAFRKDPLGFLTRAAREYGDICYFKLGPQAVYLLNHPDYIRDVLVTRQSSFTKSRTLQRAKVLLGEGLLTSEDPLHLRQRRLVQPAFHRDRLVSYAAMMTECAAKTRERWRDGETLDLATEMMRMTLAIVGRTLFSVEVEDEAGELGGAITEIFAQFKNLMLPLSQYVHRLPLPSSRRFREARLRLDKTIYRIIAERRASGEDRRDLLSMLLLARDEDGSGGMSDLQVRDEALTLFIAGHETTAVALTWTFYLLSRNSDCEARLHREIDAVLEGRLPVFDDISRLGYAEMAIAESIRLYPPAWAVSRLTKTELDIGGWRLPRGAVCLMSPWVTHRDARFFPDPERFDPERWTPEARESRPKFSYFPFGGGARVCIGERFAWTEAILVLATLAQKWRFRLASDQRAEPLPLVTLRAKHGMRMIAERRESAIRAAS